MHFVNIAPRLSLLLSYWFLLCTSLRDFVDWARHLLNSINIYEKSRHAATVNEIITGILRYFEGDTKTSLTWEGDDPNQRPKDPGTALILKNQPIWLECIWDIVGILYETTPFSKQSGPFRSDCKVPFALESCCAKGLCHPPQLLTKRPVLFFSSSKQSCVLVVNQHIERCDAQSISKQMVCSVWCATKKLFCGLIRIGNYDSPQNKSLEHRTLWLASMRNIPTTLFVWISSITCYLHLAIFISNSPRSPR